MGMAPVAWRLAVGLFRRWRYEAVFGLCSFFLLTFLVPPDFGRWVNFFLLLGLLGICLPPWRLADLGLGFLTEVPIFPWRINFLFPD